MQLPTIRLKPLALLAALFCLLTAPAIAGDTGYGSKAWTTQDVIMHSGPGNAYPVVGEALAQNPIIVDRCHYRWCNVRIDGARGWVSIDALTFGTDPRGPFTGPRLNYGGGGGGRVCFYSGPNFTGSVTCSWPGTVVHDLKLFGIDNTFASATVEGNASAMVCRDFDFTSACTRIVEDQPTMKQFFNRSISSYRVY